MAETKRTRVGFIGLGVMARYHLGDMLRREDTEVVAVCEPSGAAYAAAAELFDQHGLAVPPNEPDWPRFVSTFADQLDAVFIITPHVLHFAQATACLEAGIDVLLEKPMVMTADEATALIESRDRTGRLLVVAFQGSLSPQVREASRLLRSGELGSILNISAVAWQDWATLTDGTWRQQPELSGGGFLFDTGAHMLNTVSDLAGEDFAQVAAWLEDDGRPVDIRAVVMGPARLRRPGDDRTPAAAPSRRAIRTSGSSRRRPSCERDLGRDPGAAARRRGPVAEGPIHRADARLGAVLNVRDGREPNPSPPRSASGWPGCGCHPQSAARDGAVITNPTAAALQVAR
jgi:hypothetical protein